MVCPKPNSIISPWLSVSAIKGSRFIGDKLYGMGLAQEIKKKRKYTMKIYSYVAFLTKINWKQIKDLSLESESDIHPW